MTARNMQEAVKKKGLPWSASKGFDTFNPVSSFIEKSSIPDVSNVRLWLKTNDQTRQDGNTKDMIFNIPQLIEHVSSIMTIEVGDLLITGAWDSVGGRH
jgi:acylpyruvate hydrolase